MELLVIFLLIFLNGVFAMAEMAMVSLRRSTFLTNQESKILQLIKNPSRFLSTIQVGITLISILTGVFGGATIAQSLAGFLKKIPLISSFSQPLALILVVIFITYLSLIFGELVPKRLALYKPEKIARLTAPFLIVFAKIVSSLIDLLSSSTEAFLKLIGVKTSQEFKVSEEEVKILIQEGTKLGVFEKIEKEIVERTFKLGDKKAKSLMTPRHKIIWLDINYDFTKIKKELSQNPRSYYPVCRQSLDNVLGVIRTEDILKHYLVEKKIDLKQALLKPILIPETTPALKVLELFKKSGIYMALIINEYGSIVGLISLTNIFEGIVGHLPIIDEPKEEAIIKRSDGSYLIDGLLYLDRFRDYFQIKEPFPEEKTSYQTLGGFIINRLGRVPQTGDKFIWDCFVFEVMDMDGNRVDKVLVHKHSRKK